MTATARSRSGSIRFRAAALTSGLIAVALITVISITIYVIRANLIATGETRATAAASQLASLVAAPLPARIAEVQRLVDDVTIRNVVSAPSAATREAALGRLKPLLANAQQHQALELWTAGGERVLAITVPPTGSTVPLAEAAPKAAGILPYTVSNGLVISEVVIPVREAGDGSPVIGHLLSRRRGTNANNNDVLNRLLGSGGRVMVGNQSGTVWADITKQIEPPALDVASPGIRRYRDAGGEERLAAVAHVAATPLALVVDFPLAAMVAPAWTMLRALALVGAVFIALAVVVVWRVTGRITRPLDELTGAIDAMSEGDLSTRVNARRDTEVGRLGDAFNEMAAKIQSGLTTLEERARELREKDQRKAAMMNAALDGIITADGSGRITDCNPAAARVFGYDTHTLLGQHLASLLLFPGYEGSSSFAAFIDSARNVTLDRRLEVQGRRQSGDLFTAEVSLAAIQSDGVAFAAFVRDLTEQKAGEASLLRGILLEEENRRVVEASRLKSEFLANMSHELRTPLNAIIGFAELLYDGQVTPDMPQFKEFMHDILTSGQHLLQLINDVLDLSKVEAGRLEFHPEQTDVAQVVGESIAILRTLAAQKQLTIAHDVDASIGPVLVDRARLKQVLYNYLSNAIKFTPERGRIDVRVTPEGHERIRLAVTDTGVGISEADIARLFIEFNQLEAGAAKKHQGTGLGLALTRRLIEAQGGSVGVVSSPGHGSTFFAVLPRQATRGTPLAGPRSIIGAVPGAPSVLVIEDHPADQEAIVNALVAGGFNVETATSRAQAIVKLESHTFDAITLDLVLPDATGADILRDLRSSDRNRDVPVVVITVVTGRGAVAGFAVQDILTKPIDAGRLIAALQRAGIQSAADGSILIVDDDPGSLRLMAATLTQLGYRTTSVERAIEGLRVAEQQAPLAVVLDLQMPEMDGFGFLEHFRRLPSCRHTPVIVWTVKDLSRDDHARLQASVQAVVGKGHQATSTVADELRRFTAARAATP